MKIIDNLHNEIHPDEEHVIQNSEVFLESWRTNPQNPEGGNRSSFTNPTQPGVENYESELWSPWVAWQS